MSKSKKADVIKSIVVLAVICLVISGALAVVNSFTSPVIAAAAAERETQARQAVLPEALLPDYHRLSQAERERAERLAAEAAARNNDTENGKD